KLIRKLSAYFGVLHIFSRVPFCARDPPRLSSIPWRSVMARCGSQYLIARRVLPLPRARRRTVKPFEQREFPPNRHHPPGIKNSKSESYAEIDTDGLRTRPANVVRKFAAKALGLTVPPTLLAEAGEVIE